MISRILIGLSAAIILYLGGTHLVYTAFTHGLDPAEAQLETVMRRTPMRISAETTMWRAWTGFNFSHSFALILFSLVFGYLVIFRWEVLETSNFLSVLGLLLLLAYVVLARVFWFRAPFIAVSCAMLLYVAGLFSRVARP